ncbi:MAG: phosphoribosyltransferase [Bacteroidetes bacterium]|nr:MAG: phosphoribosyltransferase [Bacteroidota bacterium]REK05243.1 MAG: phosphoribosyltransferase [Bacteroidota bacterium]REK32648.1 MAG: phosphoribosyltransferase [Bacteroidota bacterium]REK48905.1 MAG: phosphoribosyltransferase [Bacteroidota bacterium]
MKNRIKQFFESRESAGEELSQKLWKYRNGRTVVIGIPRGGVPLAAVVAKNLNLPLDVAVVKKIGHPSNPELAIGAVSSEGLILDPEAAKIPEDILMERIKTVKEQVKRQNELYRGQIKEQKLDGVRVIVIDDGMATGNTMRATLNLLRKKNPASIILAVPVASRESVRKTRFIADEFICLMEPDLFFSVGQFFRDFRAVSDKEVSRLIADANKGRNSGFGYF